MAGEKASPLLRVVILNTESIKPQRQRGCKE
jgi:hypothetical protein